MTRFTGLALLALAIVFSRVEPAHAAQSYDNCVGFIDSVPTTISQQGTWCLRKNVSTAIASGNAITISTNNVTIDCNDFKIGGLAAGIGTRAIGILALERNSIAVRNCALRGFFEGIVIDDGSGGGHLVENNRIDNSTWLGIDLGGDGSVARGNRIVDTGGVTDVGNSIKAVGIYTNGNVDIIDNVIAGVVAATGSNGYAIGINPGESDAGVITGNTVKSVVADGEGWAYGISMFGQIGRMNVQSNTLFGVGTAQTLGVWCPEENKVSVSENVISGFETSMYSCLWNDGNIEHLAEISGT